MYRKDEIEGEGCVPVWLLHVVLPKNTQNGAVEEGAQSGAPILAVLVKYYYDGCG